MRVAVQRKRRFDYRHRDRILKQFTLGQAVTRR
jgi:hypothetical protein